MDIKDINYGSSPSITTMVGRAAIEKNQEQKILMEQPIREEIRDEVPGKKIIKGSDTQELSKDSNSSATGVANSTDGARISVYEDDINYTNYESAGKQIFNVGTNGGTKAMQIDANGAVTMPLQPRLSAILGTTQAVAHDTYTMVQLNTDISTKVGFTASNSNSRFTATTAGTYRIHASMRWYTNSAISTSLMYILKNGSSIAFAYDHTLDNYSQLHATTIHTLSANDYLELQVYQYSGGSVNLNGQNPNAVQMNANLIA